MPGRTSSLQRTPALPAGGGASTLLVLAAVRAAWNQEAGVRFLVRRVEREVAALHEEERRALRGLVARLQDAPGDAGRLAQGLVVWAGSLEEAGRLEAAARALALASALHPSCPEAVLHQARIARKRGRAGQAERLYRTVRDLSGGAGMLCRMAGVGEALLAPEPVRALGRAMRASLRAGHGEAAAVAQEERAHARRRNGHRDGALRDYLIAACRYPDPVDRARVLHAAADLLSAAGDLLGAREVLLVAREEGRREQRNHAEARLHTVSRALGDEIGRRRWAGGGPAPLVSLTPSRTCGRSGSRARVVAEWRRRSSAAT